MEQEKANCWKFKKCERQLGGKRVEDFGVCPAAVDSSFNGINNGKNAGRICWAVAGTCCGGKVQGTLQRNVDPVLLATFISMFKNRRELRLRIKSF